jgi:FkbM family methyltransferase
MLLSFGESEPSGSGRCWGGDAASVRTASDARPKACASTVPTRPGLIARGICAVTRRWPEKRAVSACAFHLGEALARRPRVLVGRVPTGSPIVLSSRDRHHRHIYFYREHEPDVTSLITKLVKPGATFFDVGANAGFFTLLARDLGARVHAFEPNPKIVSLLLRSAPPEDSRVAVIPAACSDRSGSLALYLYDDTNTGMASVEKPAGRRIDVPAVTLSEYWRRTEARPDLIKVDVEGHEYQVLCGAAELIEAVRPDLIVEVTRRATFQLLATWGYAACQIGREDWTTLHETPRCDAGYQNLFFTRDEDCACPAV